MSHDLVKFLMPADFVLARSLPTPGEVAYGYEHGWLAPDDALRVALAGYGTIPDAPAAYEELALLLSDRLDRVPELIADIAKSSPPENHARIWLYLALAWTYEHRAEYPDPLSIVEQLYDDFGHPTEIERFIRFLPAPEGLPTGEEALYTRWKTYLDEANSEYRTRET